MIRMTAIAAILLSLAACSTIANTARGTAYEAGETIRSMSAW